MYALLEAVPGVDHINALTLGESVDAADIAVLGLTQATAVSAIKQAGRFLVYSGAHTITLTFEES